VIGPTAARERRTLLRRRVLLLVAATITYNLVEAVVAIGAGTVADRVRARHGDRGQVRGRVAWQFAGPTRSAGTESRCGSDAATPRDREGTARRIAPGGGMPSKITVLTCMDGYRTTDMGRLISCPIPRK
jgi:hypothetical protein